MKLLDIILTLLSLGFEMLDSNFVIFQSDLIVVCLRLNIIIFFLQVLKLIKHRLLIEVLGVVDEELQLLNLVLLEVNLLKLHRFFKSV